MIITEKQLLVLFKLASCIYQIDIERIEIISPFKKETIRHLINDIYNQQSNVLIEVK